MQSIRACVAAPDVLAAEGGVRLAAMGGNAVDAALAAVLVAMVAEPGVCSPGAGGFVTVAPADGSQPVTVDGNVEMPGRGLPPERFGRGLRLVETAYGGGLVMTVGHGSVATPGAFAAFAVAHERYGRAPWSEVVAPAFEVARDGFPLGSSAASYLEFAHDIVFGWHPDSHRALHHDDGSPLRVGETVWVEHLADSMAHVAAEGAGALYRGDLARAIASDMAANDGILTAADLAAYRPVVRPALAVAHGTWQLFTNPPPSIGGTTLAAMLALLAGTSVSDVARLLSVQEAVLRHRIEVLDLEPDLERSTRELLDQVHAGAVLGPPSTVHVSAVDSEGCACAVTASAGYGSGVMVPGTGLWLNNCLGEPELNRRGMHALEPGDRLPSNMAPTVGHAADGAVLAIGSPGADRITSALLQVLAAMGEGSSLAAAIERPRLHVRVVPGGGAVIEHEADLLAGAEMTGWPWPTREHPASSMYFGGVTAALREADGTLVAAADPRRVGAVAIR